MYIQRIPPVARRILAGFGIIFGAEHVVLYVEPRDSLDIRADTARSRILINGQDVEEANWWEIWGEEFREKIPHEIKAKIDEIMAKAEEDPEGKTRERVLKRLRRIRELLRPSRYRRDPQGGLTAAGEVSGGVPSAGGSSRAVSAGGGSGRRGGRSSDDYLAELVDTEGEPVTAVTTSPKEPKVMWVSRSSGTRDEEEMIDVAAEIVGDELTGELIKANADFRGFVDLITFFGKDSNPHGDEAIKRKIVEYVQEWLEFQLIEVVMTVRNLANGGRTWGSDQIKQALSPYALTSVVMSRFHIVEKVKRSLSSDLSRPKAA